MPPRVIDYEAIWSSEKLCKLPEWAQLEYLWMYGIADQNGSFEIPSDLNLLRRRIGMTRPAMQTRRVRHAIELFATHGLLFRWTVEKKTFGHWVGSDRPGRLPVLAHRLRYKTSVPSVPKKELEEYVSRIHPDTSGTHPDASRIHPDRIGEGEGKDWIGEGKGQGEGGGVEEGEPKLPKIVSLEAHRNLSFSSSDLLRTNHCKDCGGSFTPQEFMMHKCQGQLERMARRGSWR